MNYRMMLRIQAWVLAIEAALMLPPLGISLFVRDHSGTQGFLISIGIILLVAAVLGLFSRGAKMRFYAREGLMIVGVSWVLLSVLGCLPFFISGQIPNYIDALFEIVSGFTTTGASICPNVEALGKGILWWRSFSHWVGGMGILVFFLAIIPLTKNNEGYSLHILRAESPGPKVDKMVPKMKQSAKLLYMIYCALTIADILFLIILGRMPVFDACCIAFGTAGTGGFSVLNSGCATYTPMAQYITSIFMLAFGINFSVYYLIVMKKYLAAIKDEEVHVYLGIVLLSVVLISVNILRNTAETMGLEPTIRHALFQTASIVTTTGYSTVNFDLWPSFSKGILLMLMFMGASAGSTGGGIKVARVMILWKAAKRSIRSIIHPSEVNVIRMNGSRVDEATVSNTLGYLAIYVFIVIISYLLVSLDANNFSMMSHFSGVMATFNNIGPGFEQVGAAMNFSLYSGFSKIIFIMDMLLGRLEIMPILVLLAPRAYKKG